MSTGTHTGSILLSVTGWDPAEWKALIEGAAPKRPVVLEPASPADPAIEYAVVWKHRPQVLSTLPNLKAIFSLGAGVDHIFNDPDLPKVPIVRVVSPDLTMRMSEYVVWQVLDHHRLGALYRRQQRARIWHEDRRQPAASEVTVGIMGLGALGLDAGLKLRALGFDVCGWSRTEKRGEDGIRRFHGTDGLKPFLALCDILVCLLPLTPDTQRILSRDLFAMLKREGPLGAPILINAGRGGLQVEDDILAALDAGQLSAAALDVFTVEPLPADHPLWAHPKVTITPHAAATSSPRAIVPDMVRQMEAHDRGEALRNLVDPQMQY